MIYLIITASRRDQYKNMTDEDRKKTYEQSIATTLGRVTPEIKPIIVDNNGDEGRTYLDDFGVDVVYTDHQTVEVPHKGYKEWMDLREVIRRHAIGPEDWVIKLTGRYEVTDDSFFRMVLDHQDRADALIKFQNICTGQFVWDDCVLGLFAIRARYITDWIYRDAIHPEREFATHIRSLAQAQQIRLMEMTHLGLHAAGLFA